MNESDRIGFVKRDGETIAVRFRLSLLDMRGTVHVSGKQDFETIRKEVRGKRVMRGR